MGRGPKMGLKKVIFKKRNSTRFGSVKDGIGLMSRREPVFYFSFWTSRDVAATATIPPTATPSRSLRNNARTAVAPPATKSRKSPLFREDLSMTSAARTRSRAKKYAGSCEIAEVRRKNIGQAANWLIGSRNDRISVSRKERPLIQCNGDRGIEKATQLFLLLFGLIFLTASQSRHRPVKIVQDYFSKFHVDLLYLVS